MEKILLEPRFCEPAGLEILYFFNEKGKKVRYARLGCPAPVGVVVYHAGLGQPLEADYENMRTFRDIGLITYTLERYGENGSDRMYSGADRQKPPALPARYFAEDLVYFIANHVETGGLPTYFVGSCYGCLVGLTSSFLNDSIFKKLILAAPMFGSYFFEKHGGIYQLAALELNPEQERQYWGKARDWTWPLAQKILRDDPTSSDAVRGTLIHLWRKKDPRLRIGGFTHGRIKYTAQSLVEIFQPGALEKIQTPVVIISAELDTHNVTARHIEVAKRLPNSVFYQIKGARHGLFRESDTYRDQVFEIIKACLYTRRKVVYGKQIPGLFTG